MLPHLDERPCAAKRRWRVQFTTFRFLCSASGEWAMRRPTRDDFFCPSSCVMIWCWILFLSLLQYPDRISLPVCMSVVPNLEQRLFVQIKPNLMSPLNTAFPAQRLYNFKFVFWAWKSIELVACLFQERFVSSPPCTWQLYKICNLTWIWKSWWYVALAWG